MPAFIFKALFVLTGLMLVYELAVVIPHVRQPALRCAVHAVMGVCVLLLANTVGAVFGVGIGLNAMTLPVAAGLGAPGVVLLWAMRYLL